MEKVFLERKAAIVEGMQLSPTALHEFLIDKTRSFEHGVMVLPFLLVMDEVTHYLGVEGSLQSRIQSPLSHTAHSTGTPIGVAENNVVEILQNLQALQRSLIEEVRTEQRRGVDWTIIAASQDHQHVANRIHDCILAQVRKALQLTQE